MAGRFSRSASADFERILEDLKKGLRKNQKTWKRLLEQVPSDVE